MKVINIIKGTVIILFVSVIAGIILLTLAFVLPTDLIKTNIISTVNTFADETDYRYIDNGVDSTLIDNYTDAFMLNESLFGLENDIGNFNNVLEGNIYISEEKMPMTELLSMIVDNSNSGNLTVIPSSKRFWNGYLIPLKLCLTKMNYVHIRYVNYIFQLILMGILCGFLYKRNLLKYSIPIGLAYLCMNPLTLAFCLTFSAFYYCTVIPSIIMLAFHDKLKIGNRYLFYFEEIGICTAYFCMNYFQLIALVFPLALYIILNEKEETAREIMKKCLWLSFLWFVGYYGMMAAKWVVYGIFVDWSIFSEIFDNVVFRLSSDNFGTSFTRFDAIKQNIDTALSDKPGLLTEAGFILVCLMRIMKKHRYSFSKVYLAIFSLSCLIPIARYFIFANHVYIHHWVMYRLLVIPVFCLDMIMIRVATDNSESELKQISEESENNE